LCRQLAAGVPSKKALNGKSSFGLLRIACRKPRPGCVRSTAVGRNYKYAPYNYRASPCFVKKEVKLSLGYQTILSHYRLSPAVSEILGFKRTGVTT